MCSREKHINVGRTKKKCTFFAYRVPFDVILFPHPSQFKSAGFQESFLEYLRHSPPPLPSACHACIRGQPPPFVCVSLALTAQDSFVAEPVTVYLSGNGVTAPIDFRPPWNVGRLHGMLQEGVPHNIVGVVVGIFCVVGSW